MYKNEIGGKLRNYRQRAGKSQLQLEVDIEASTGSISRIESGKINPTKETLFKISHELKLTPEETADLFGIRLKLVEQKAKYTLNISPDPSYENYYEYLRNLNIRQLLGEISKELIKEDFFHVSVYILDDKSQTLRLIYDEIPNKVKVFAKEIIRKDINEVEYSLKDNTLITNAVNTGQIQTTRMVFELIIPHLGGLYAVKAENNATEMVAIPLILDSKIVGCLTLQSQRGFSEEDLEILSKSASKFSKAVFTLKLKSEESSIESQQKILNTLLDFFQFENIWELIKYDRSMQIFISIFIFFTTYWLINQFLFLPTDCVYIFWGDIYFLAAVLAFIIGVRIFLFVGKFRNRLGSLLFILVLIALGHIIGQCINALITRFFGVDLIYPSFGELGFLLASLLSLFLAIKLSFFINVRFSLYRKPGVKAIFISGSIILIFIKSYLLLKYNYINEGNLKLILDFIYVISTSLAVSFSLLSFFLLKSVNISKEFSFFIILYTYATIVIFFADILFVYRYNNNLWNAGDISDFLYFLYYSLIAFGHVALLATIKRDASIKMEGMELKDYKYAVEDVVEKMVS